MQAKREADQKATRDQIVGLRRAFVEYHPAVVGHGVLISELEARAARGAASQASRDDDH
jgi:hypothetical protein